MISKSPPRFSMISSAWRDGTFLFSPAAHCTHGVAHSVSMKKTAHVAGLVDQRRVEQVPLPPPTPIRAEGAPRPIARRGAGLRHSSCTPPIRLTRHPRVLVLGRARRLRTDDDDPDPRAGRAGAQPTKARTKARRKIRRNNHARRGGGGGGGGGKGRRRRPAAGCRAMASQSSWSSRTRAATGSSPERARPREPRTARGGRGGRRSSVVGGVRRAPKQCRRGGEEGAEAVSSTPTPRGARQAARESHSLSQE